VQQDGPASEGISVLPFAFLPFDFVFVLPFSGFAVC
jgi:hypothetical protein